MHKKKIKKVFSLIVLLISIVSILFLDNSSKTVSPFNFEDPGPSAFSEPIFGRIKSDVDYFEKEFTSQVNLEEGGNEMYLQNQNSLDQVGFKVVKVVDGDTIDVNIDGKIERLRIIGIDTPETVDPRKSVQCFGIEASNKAKELLNGQFVSLEPDSTQGNRDKYGRLLRYAFLPNGTNFGLFMISEGFAHEYTYRLPYKYQAEFKQAELDAQNSNKGLWSPDTCSGNK